MDWWMKQINSVLIKNRIKWSGGNLCHFMWLVGLNSLSIPKKEEEFCVLQTSPSKKSFPVFLPFVCWTPDPVSLTSRSRNRKDIIAAAGNTATTLNTPVVTETAETSMMPNSNGNCKQGIGNKSIMGHMFWKLKLWRFYWPTWSSICDMIAVLTHAYPNSSSRLTPSLWVCVNEFGQGQLCTDNQMWRSAK